LTVNDTSSRERLVTLIKRFAGQRVVVIGDTIADQFLYGAISRVSREAPVFILQHEQTETVPGGAANCALNLASLGAKVSLVSVAGDDEAGRSLLETLNGAGVDCSGLMIERGLRTTTKVRILAGQVHSTRQQVIRIDYDGQNLTNPKLRQALLEQVRTQTNIASAIVVSDYNYGVADSEIASLARAAATTQKIPVLADSRFHLTNFAGFTSATPNQDEVEHLTGKQFDDINQLVAAAEELRSRLEHDALLVTRGSNGLMLLEKGGAPLHLEAVGAHDPVDVTGAGDTVMAAYTLALASGSSFSDAARLANYAGGLVVMKRGTASVSSQELEDSVLSVN
jgi:D-glycero-beta-D-manno-heptose-7-phosphate kinase